VKRARASDGRSAFIATLAREGARPPGPRVPAEKVRVMLARVPQSAQRPQQTEALAKRA
jgi:hypothetical protein